jgi:2'-5' RNA ligase
MERFGIALCFDPATEAKLRALQDTLKLNGIESQDPPAFTRPHVTLAALQGGTLSELREYLGVFAESSRCVEGRLHSVGMYPPGDEDVFLTLTATPALRLFHQRFVAGLAPRFMLCEEYHHPDRWAPHCTIAYSLAEADIPSAVKLCRTSDVFHSVNLIEVAIVGPPSGMEIGTAKLVD